VKCNQWTRSGRKKLVKDALRCIEMQEGDDNSSGRSWMGDSEMFWEWGETGKTYQTPREYPEGGEVWNRKKLKNSSCETSYIPSGRGGQRGPGVAKCPQPENLKNSCKTTHCEKKLGLGKNMPRDQRSLHGRKNGKKT